MIGGLKELTLDQTKMLHIQVFFMLQINADKTQVTPEGMCWCPNPTPFVGVAVSHAGKKQKYHGLKTFDAYSISGGVS